MEASIESAQAESRQSHAPGPPLFPSAVIMTPLLPRVRRWLFIHMPPLSLRFLVLTLVFQLWSPRSKAYAELTRIHPLHLVLVGGGVHGVGVLVGQERLILLFGIDLVL